MAEHMTVREIRMRRREILQEQLRLEEEKRLRDLNMERERQRIYTDVNRLQSQRELLLVQRRNQQRHMGVIHSCDITRNEAPVLQDRQVHTYGSDNVTTGRNINAPASRQYAEGENLPTTEQDIDEGSYMGYVNTHERYPREPDSDNLNTRNGTASDRAEIANRSNPTHDRSSLDLSLETEVLEERLRDLRGESETRYHSQMRQSASVTQPKYPIERRITENGHSYMPQHESSEIHHTYKQMPEGIHNVDTYTLDKRSESKRHSIGQGLVATHERQQDIDDLEFLDRKMDEITLLPIETKVRGELGSNVKDEETIQESYKENVITESVNREITEIERRKAELRDLIEIEDRKHKEILQEEKKRMVELDRQRMMLDELVKRENVMRERERKLQEEERNIDMRYERLRIAEEQKKREDENSKEIARIESELRRRNEELTKREAHLRKKEELWSRYEKTSSHERPEKEVKNEKGNEPKPKDEVTLEEWKTEIRCLCATKLYHENIIAQAVRQSLKGQARKVLINIPPTATPEEIISKVEDIFGDMSSKQTIFTQFYTAEQQPNESIVEWGLRLEEMLQLIEAKRSLTIDERNEMLRDKFWRSLLSKELKNATRHAFESGEKFEVLRRKARAEEHEMKLDKTNTNTTMSKKEEQLKAEDKHTEMLQSMMKKMEALDSKIEEYRKESQRRDSRSDYRYNRGDRREYQPRDYNRYDDSRYNRSRHFDSRNHRPTGYNKDIDKKKEDKDDTKDKRNNKAENNKEKNLN
ncbi:trichohyalin-like [Mercenaria mercenaria]|uniref:trichohyalin-like n=1 Tax=Mercenaria mercenaria TaxID=6596 RepID=UPI00234E61F9|nr:trichohyalin-like [Mercenaria mercenaria]